MLQQQFYDLPTSIAPPAVGDPTLHTEELILDPRLHTEELILDPRLHTEELLRNSNRTVRFGPASQPEFLAKRTSSGLWQLCYSRREYLAQTCLHNSIRWI